MSQKDTQTVTYKGHAARDRKHIGILNLDGVIMHKDRPTELPAELAAEVKRGDSPRLKGINFEVGEPEQQDGQVSDPSVTASAPPATGVPTPAEANPTSGKRR